MRKKHCFLIVFLLITLQSFAQQSKHVIDGKIIKASPTSADSMTLRIKQAAENYKVTSDSCLILSDYAFGDGQYEFTQLNGIGLLYFSIVTRDSIDIQKVRVYYERLDLNIGFQKIRYYAIPITDELTRIKIGDKRYDFYCFIQYSISQGIGDLNVKFGDAGKVVKIGSFPSKLKLDMSFDPKVGTTDPRKTISMPDLKHFLIREFGLFLER